MSLHKVGLRDISIQGTKKIVDSTNNKTYCSYSSGTLMSIVRTARTRITSNQQDAIVAIVFSALAIEAFLADMIYMAEIFTSHSESPSTLKDFARLLKKMEKDRSSIELKLQMASKILQSETMDEGTQPYQDFAVLVELRNHLVHVKPDTVVQTDEGAMRNNRRIDNTVRKLAEKGFIAKDKLHLPWVMNLLNEETATWSYNTARNLMRTLVAMIADTDFKHTMERILVIIDGKIPAGSQMVE